MPAINFPASTEPGINKTEGGGRLINAFVDQAPDGSRSRVIYRRVPGLVERFAAGSDGFRGALSVGNILYVVNGNTAYSVTVSGGAYVVSSLGGSVPGAGKVKMARNMALPTNVLIVHSAGMSEISGGSVVPFSDPSLPDPVDIDFLDGYFFFAISDGRCFASGINLTSVNALDFTTAESSPDGLLRCVAFRRELLLMGETSIEFYSNTGNPTGFPFSRGPVLKLGLFGKNAVAGNEQSFPGNLIFAGSDGRVYQLSGYSPEPISTPYIESLISKITNRDDLEASTFVSSGHACVVLQTSDWTMVYDMRTGQWHERASYGSVNWMAQGGIYALGSWIVFDKSDTGRAFSVEPSAYKEGDNPLVWELRSAQEHRFPGRFVVNRASFDFLTGVGIDAGIDPIETNPVVSISWSDDGGRTFGNPLVRELGTTGEQRDIDIFRCGLTGSLGRQWRLQVSDPVEIAFMGGAFDFEERKAS